jgi:AcrR family transcriptional regulator
MRRTREDAEVTRQGLLDAALHVFCRKGYAETRLEDVAEEAKVTRGAIYHHFGGKEELYLALVEERFSRALQMLQEIMQQPDAPLKKIRTLMVRSLEYLEEDPDYRIVQELILFKTAYVPELAQSMQQKVKNTRDFVTYLAHLVKLGQEEGVFRPEINNQTAAVAALGLINGVMTTWLMDPESFSIKSAAPGIVDLYLAGLAI